MDCWMVALLLDCRTLLDQWEEHALKCEVGATSEGRHDSLRDFTAAFHPRVCGHIACKEQHLMALDRVNLWTGILEEARLDVATRCC